MFVESRGWERTQPVSRKQEAPEDLLRAPGIDCPPYQDGKYGPSGNRFWWEQPGPGWDSCWDVGWENDVPYGGRLFCAGAKPSCVMAAQARIRLHTPLGPTQAKEFLERGRAADSTSCSVCDHHVTSSGNRVKKSVLGGPQHLDPESPRSS